MQHDRRAPVGVAAGFPVHAVAIADVEQANSGSTYRRGRVSDPAKWATAAAA